MTASGRLLVDKAEGPTSHDVVARARRLLGERRIGHAGTLDPMATGLLVLAVGPATRLLRFAQGGEKRYVGRARLGVATDSLDAQGAPTATCAVPPLTPEALERAATGLRGRQLQVPPMVSAVQVGGRRLHELARQGVEVERAPREIEVSELSVVASGPDEVTFVVRCSPGTYVRVLLADLAERLGTVGHLVALRRTRSGTADVASALTLDVLEAALAEGREVIDPPITLTESMTRRSVSASEARRLRQGQRLAAAASDPEWVAATDDAGDLVAVLARRGDALAPEVVMPEGAGEEPR